MNVSVEAHSDNSTDAVLPLWFFIVVVIVLVYMYKSGYFHQLEGFISPIARPPTYMPYQTALPYYTPPLQQVHIV